MHTLSRLGALAALFAAALLALPGTLIADGLAGGAARSAPAQTFVVTKTADTNDGTCDADCSLREALAAADANAAPEADTVTFASGVAGTITLALDALAVNSDVVIDGPGADVLAVSGDDRFRVFDINEDGNEGVTATLHGLTIERGAFRNGAGINIDRSTVTISACVIQDNTAREGGGIFVFDGPLTILNSTLRNNAATDFGGGAIFNEGAEITLINSTISGNSGQEGGGLNNEGTATILNSTFADNTADDEGANILNQNVSSLEIGNSILERGAADDNVVGTSISQSLGFNVCDDGCEFIDLLPSDLVNTDPLIGPLADNGGPTLTHAPLAGSPAVDIGGTCESTDQRGEAAPTDGDGDGTADCDAGAVEAPALVCPADLFVDASRSASGDGLTWGGAFDDLQDALALARLCPAGAVEAVHVAEGTYTPSATGDQSESFTLTGDTDGLTVLGGYPSGGGTRDPEANVSVLSGDLAGDDGPDFANAGENSNTVVVFDGSTAGPVTAATVLDGFTVTGGSAVAAGRQLGGGIVCDASAGGTCEPTLVRLVIAGNQAGAGGGLYAIGSGGGTASPSLANVAIVGNNTTVAGGAVYIIADGGTASPRFVNVLFTGVESRGTTVSVGTSNAGTAEPVFDNVTLAYSFRGISAGDDGTGMASLTVRNSILGGNPPIGTIPRGTVSLNNASATVTSSLVEGGCPTGAMCTDVIDADPLFADVPSGDYTLAPGSPAVNLGDAALLPPDTADLDGDGDGDTAEPLPVDLAGNERVRGGGLDLGAFEAQASPPVADAGVDQTAECAAPVGTEVALDGSASSDPDGDIASYVWTDADGAEVASGATPTVSLGLGASVLTLTVTDAAGLSDTDEVTVTVEDTTPPAIALTGQPIVEVARFSGYADAGATATDACDGSVGVTASGAVDTTVPGAYTVTYTAADAAGNAAAAERTVVVVDDPALLPAYALLADKSVKADESDTSGPAHANDKADLKGKRGGGTHTGDLTASDEVKLKRDQVVDGDVTAPRVRLDRDADVTGTATEADVAQVALPALPDFEAGHEKVELKRGETLALAPGVYGDVKVERGSVLTLSAGVYTFGKLDVKRDARVEADISAGPVTVRVDGNVKVEKGSAVVVVSPLEDDPGASRYLTLLVDGHVHVKDDSRLEGTVVAPGDHVKVEKGSSLVGAIAARDVDVKRSTVASHAAGFVAPEAAALVAGSAPSAKASGEGSGEGSPAGGPDATAATAGAAVTASEAPPEAITVASAYPNPSRGRVALRYGLPEAGPVRLTVYDALGREVAVLVDGPAAAGWHEATVEGAALPAGVYVVRLAAGQEADVLRFTLVR